MAAAEAKYRVTLEEVSPHLAELQRKVRERATRGVEQAIAKPTADFVVALQDALKPIVGHRCDLLVQELTDALLEDLRPIAVDTAEQACMRALIDQLASGGARPSTHPAAPTDPAAEPRH